MKKIYQKQHIRQVLFGSGHLPTGNYFESELIPREYFQRKVSPKGLRFMEPTEVEIGEKVIQTPKSLFG